MKIAMWFLAFAAAVVVPGCGNGSAGGSPSSAAPAPSKSVGRQLVVATSTAVLADLIRNVAGEGVEVINLVPADRTPPLYEMSPRDAITASRASVVFVNGYGYEPPSFGQLLLSTKGLRVVLLSDGLSAQETVIDHGDHEHRFQNAYFYLDVRLAIRYVEHIRRTLADLDPDGASAYEANARAYVAQLEELDTWISTEVTRIPEGKRRLMTDQASFPYFADRYGFRAFAASYEGTAETTPSPSQYAYLLEQVKQWGVVAAFGEEGGSPKLLQQLARDTGIRFVPGLRSSTLDPAKGAASYIEMMRGNTRVIVEALS